MRQKISLALLALLAVCPVWAQETREPRLPSFSADGNVLAYTADVKDKAKGVLPFSSEIWTIRRDGSGARRLTEGHEDHSPRLSPDGQRIVFEREMDLWLVNTDGSGLRNFTQTPNDRETGAHWASDGQGIFFVRHGSKKMDEEDKKFAAEDPLAAAFAFKEQTLDWRSTQDNRQRTILGNDYGVKQVVLRHGATDAILVLCHRLEADGKPVNSLQAAFSSPVVAEFKLDGSYVRTVYALEKESKDEIEKISAGGARLLLAIEKGGVGLPETYSLDLNNLAAPPTRIADVVLFSDLSCDGNLIATSGLEFEPNLHTALKIYDCTAQTTTPIVEKAEVKAAVKAAVQPAQSTPAPLTSRDYWRQGNLHYLAGRYGEAVAAYSEAIKLDPQYVVAFYNRGMAHSAKNDEDAALKDYDAALAIDKTFFKAHVNRGVILQSKGLKGEALDAYNAAIELDPKNPQWLYNRGVLHSERMEGAEALRDFDAAIALNPKYVKAYIARGDELLIQKDYPAALKDFDAAIALEPQNASIYRSRAALYRATGKEALAQSDEEKAALLEPK